MGVHWTVPGRQSRVDWYGCGPHECYTDRKTGAWLRRYHVSHVDELHVPYIYPGTCILPYCDFLASASEWARQLVFGVRQH